MSTMGTFTAVERLEADNIRVDYAPSIETVTAAQQYAFMQNPFEVQFHPRVEPPILNFDPMTIQSDFDPFALTFGDLVNTDLFED